MSFPIGPITRTPAEAMIVANMLAQSIAGVETVLADDPLDDDERAATEHLLAELRQSFDTYWALAHNIDWS